MRTRSSTCESEWKAKREKVFEKLHNLADMLETSLETLESNALIKIDSLLDEAKLGLSENVDHDLFHHPWPVACEDDVTLHSSMGTMQIIYTSDEQEESAKSPEDDKGQVTENTTNVKKKKKRRNKRKGKSQGFQTGRGQTRGGGEENRCKEQQWQKPESVQNAFRGHLVDQGDGQRKAVGDHAGDEGSGSDDEKNEKDNIKRGHYAGIPDTPREHKFSSFSAQLVADFFIDPKKKALERILASKKKGIGQDHLVNLVGSHIVHCSYRIGFDDCEIHQNEMADKCLLVKKLLRHHKNHQAGCQICLIVECGTISHATKCENLDCEVFGCNYWKECSDRKVQGKVIHSTTSLFKQGHNVIENCDYTFLHKIEVGVGATGVANRAWFYHLQKEIEADLVLKEMKKDPSGEAIIHRVIRHNHPNLLGAMCIIQLHQENSGIKGYMLMERGECSLYDLKKYFVDVYNRRLSLEDCRYYWFQISEGLRYLHSLEIVHKDIKDKNMVMFNNHQQLKICDWDVAVSLETEKTELLPCTGTKGFAAKEVMEKRSHGTPADIFSSAVTFLELRYGGMYRRQDDKPDGIAMRRSDALKKLKKEDAELGDLVECCLSDDPEQRPTAYDLVRHKCLRLEKNYKAVSSVNHVPVGLSGSIDQRHFGYLEGETGDKVRERSEQILRSDNVVAMMDALCKTLPTENVPQTSDWDACEPELANVEDMEIDDSGSTSAMDTY